MCAKVIHKNSVGVFTQTYRSLGSVELERLKPEAILSETNRLSCLKRLQMIKTPVCKTGNNAAVLIPFCVLNDKVGLLYTLRSNKVSMNRGQVSFPGGMFDQSDKDLTDTALRETWEELGIPKETITVWGTGNKIKRKNVNIVPVLGKIEEFNFNNLQINKDEVEEAFFHPLDKLCDPTFYRYTQFKNSYTLPAYLGAKYRIWGLTAVITHIVMHALVPEVYKHKLPLLDPLYN